MISTLDDTFLWKQENLSQVERSWYQHLKFLGVPTYKTWKLLPYQFQTMFTPLLWALGKDLVQGGQRQNTIDQMQLWGFILSTPTIASDKYFRKGNVWREKDTILANYWHGLMLCRSWDMYVYAHSTTPSYAYNVVLKYINSCGIFSSLKGLTDAKQYLLWTAGNLRQPLIWNRQQ